jgi:hypothetical protein
MAGMKFLLGFLSRGIDPLEVGAENGSPHIGARARYGANI